MLLRNSIYHQNAKKSVGHTFSDGRSAVSHDFKFGVCRRAAQPSTINVAIRTQGKLRQSAFLLPFQYFILISNVGEDDTMNTLSLL